MRIGNIFEMENINTLDAKGEVPVAILSLMVRTRTDPFQRTAHGESTFTACGDGGLFTEEKGVKGTAILEEN